LSGGAAHQAGFRPDVQSAESVDPQHDVLKLLLDYRLWEGRE
jgi:hypothetical protein